MPKDNNIWSKTFNRSSLENEDWLEPSPLVFEKVKGQVYEKKKKGKRFYFLLLLLVGICTLVFYILNSPSEADSLENIRRNINSKSSSPVKKVSYSKVKNSESNKIVTKTEDIDLSKEKGVNKGNLQMVTEEGSKNHLNSPVDYSGGEKKLAGNSLGLLGSIKSKDDDESAQNRIPIDKGLEKIISPDTHDGAKRSSDIQSSQKVLPFMPNAQLPVNLDFDKKLLSFPKLDIRIEELAKSRSFLNDAKLTSSAANKALRNEVLFAVGYTNWLFDLNRSYETALDPADFSHQAGNGLSGMISYRRRLSEKWSIGGDFSLSRISALSGHNSNVEYSLEDEHGGAMNEFMLTMASPLGFVESNVAVERLSSNGGNPSQNITLDLHNSHKMTNISFAPMVNYNIFNNGKISLSASLGGGVNYLFAIKNELTSFGVDHNNFKSLTSNITENQTELQLLTPFTSLGLDVKKNLSNMFYIGANVRFNRNVSPIYKEEDFSSSITRTQVFLFAGKHF